MVLSLQDLCQRKIVDETGNYEGQGILESFPLNVESGIRYAQERIKQQVYERLKAQLLGVHASIWKDKYVEKIYCKYLPTVVNNDWTPSGTVNFSRIYNVTLQFTDEDEDEEEEINDNHIRREYINSLYDMTQSFNVLRIMSGMGGVRYSS